MSIRAAVHVEAADFCGQFHKFIDTLTQKHLETSTVELPAL